MQHGRGTAGGFSTQGVGNAGRAGRPAGEGSLFDNTRWRLDAHCREKSTATVGSLRAVCSRETELEAGQSSTGRET